MSIYDPIGEALGLAKTDMSEFYSQVFPKIATNWNIIPWNKGKTYSLGPYPKERGEAISKAKKGKPLLNTRGSNHHSSKPIYCVTTGEYFESSGEAVRKYPNMNRQNLCAHLKGRQKTIDNKVFIYST